MARALGYTGGDFLPEAHGRTHAPGFAIRDPRDMIGRIAGTLLEKNPPHLLVDCHGVGYEIDVPMSTFYNLPQTGCAGDAADADRAREDAHLLYGFATAAERNTFRELIKITGIGARMALAVLSGMSVVSELAQPSRCRKPAGSRACPASARRRPSGCCWS